MNYYTGQQSTEDAAARAAGDAAQKRASQSSWPPTESDFEAVGAAAGSAGGAAACVATGAGAGAAGLCAAVGGVLGGAIGSGVYQLGDAIASGLCAGCVDTDAIRRRDAVNKAINDANYALNIAIMRLIAIANYGATPQQAEEQIPPNEYPATPPAPEYAAMIKRIQDRGGLIEQKKEFARDGRFIQLWNRAIYRVRSPKWDYAAGRWSVTTEQSIAELDHALRVTWPALAGVTAEVITQRQQPTHLARNPAALLWAIRQQAQLDSLPAKLLSGVRKFFGRVLGI